MTSPFHDNPSASPSTATGEQRTLLEVSSAVVAHDDIKRSKKVWCSFLAAATLLLVCLARRRGVFPTVHYSHLLHGNTAGSSNSGSRSEMSAVHYVPDAGKGESCLEVFGTSCGSDLSCDDNHVCQDNAKPGELCGPAANGIDCVAGYWCRFFNGKDDDFSDVAHEKCIDHFW